MFLFWKRKELYCGTSLERFSAMRVSLYDSKIRFSYKLRKHEDLPPFRSAARNVLGRVGENLGVSTTYYIYVDKVDFDTARQAVENIN